MAVVPVDVVVVHSAVMVQLHREAVDDLLSIPFVIVLGPLAGTNKLGELILRVVHIPINRIIFRLKTDHEIDVAPVIRLYDVQELIDVMELRPRVETD